jgi:hypothetical protein
MIRTADGFAATDAAGEAAMAKIPTGTQVLAKVSRPRSLRQHRMFWALLTHVSEATDYDTPEQLLVAIKIALGRYDLVKLPSGKVVPVTHSSSFASMPHDDFCVFLDGALRLICRDVLPGMTTDDLIRECGIAQDVAALKRKQT